VRTGDLHARLEVFAVDVRDASPLDAGRLEAMHVVPAHPARADDAHHQPLVGAQHALAEILRRPHLGGKRQRTRAQRRRVQKRPPADISLAGIRTAFVLLAWHPDSPSYRRLPPPASW